MADPRFPIGRFELPPTVGPEQRAKAVTRVTELPERVRRALSELDATLHDTPYREGGWTVRQVVHHLADSHMNAYVRFRLGLTEDEPTIKPYAEQLWAELEDARRGAIDPSLDLLEGLHDRWAALMRSMRAEDWRRTFRHPDLGVLSLDQVAALYSWHGRHHLAHIRSVGARRA